MSHAVQYLADATNRRREWYLSRYNFYSRSALLVLEIAAQALCGVTSVEPIFGNVMKPVPIRTSSDLPSNVTYGIVTHNFWARSNIMDVCMASNSTNKIYAIETASWSVHSNVKKTRYKYMVVVQSSDPWSSVLA